MTRTLYALTVGSLLACPALVGCGAHSAAVSDSPASDSGPATTREKAAEVTISDAMAGSIRVEPAREIDLARTFTIAGKVQFDEERVARVLAPLAGQIVDLTIKVGDMVRKGQMLCAINSREVAAAVGEHVESHKDLDLAERTATMTQDLFDHQAASSMALQQAQNDLAKARARVARTEEALRVLGLDPDAAPIDRFGGRVPIVSPLGGTIIERRITNGQFVQSDSAPIITVADLSMLWVVGDIGERDLHLVSVGDEATISTAAYAGELFQGRVNHISDVIDPATRTAKVRVTVPNPHGRLKPEMFASIALAGEPTRSLTLPGRAVFIENGSTWVYVATAPRKFARRAVDIAPEQGSQRRVLGGLSPGDRIVVDGALLLRSEEDKRNQ